MARNHKPQTPGETAAPAPEQAPAADEAQQVVEDWAAQPEDTTQADDAPDETPAVTDAVPEAADEEAAPAPEQEKTSDIPDASDIDPSKIDRPVLTTSGWVVPHKEA